MKKLLLLLNVLFFALNLSAQSRKDIESYVTFLDNIPKQSAKDYAISKFQDNDIVILCERHHAEMKQHDLILEIIKNPYFIENVGVIFTEVGSRMLYPELNSFLQNSNLTEDEINEKLLYFQKNCMFPIWTYPSFSHLIKEIHKINTGLSDDKKIRMYPTDLLYIEGEITDVKVKEMVKRVYPHRDQFIADYIIDNLNQLKNKNPEQKALVIMNYRHAYKKIITERGDNAGVFISEEYPGKVVNILINTYDVFKNQPFVDGKWDAAFKAKNINNLGFDFENSPFGEDNFDHWLIKNDSTYKAMFDGFVYYYSPEDFAHTEGMTGLMKDSIYKEKVVEEIILFEKTLSEFRDEEFTPMDKEVLMNNIMELNVSKTSPIPHLDKINLEINKWLIGDK